MRHLRKSKSQTNILHSPTAFSLYYIEQLITRFSWSVNQVGFNLQVTRHISFKALAKNMLARLERYDNVVFMRSHFYYWRHLLEHRNQRNRLVQLYFQPVAAIAGTAIAD